MIAFVYGTLKKDYCNHRLLGMSKFVGKGEIRGFKLYDIGEFPAIKESFNGNDVVEGELYHVDEKTLAALDCLEGEGYLYKRRETIAYAGTKEINVFVYIYLRELRSAKRLEKEWRRDDERS